MQHNLTKTTNQNDLEGNINTFYDLGLRPELVRGIFNASFEKPFEIQSKSILSLLKRKDTIIKAQSGTGKTLAYLIAILQLIDLDLPKCQALVLTPTRELAKQIQALLERVGQHLRVSIHACVGGANIKEDIKKFEEGVQVVIGTTGRAHDFITKRLLDIKYLKLFILDEADEILARGFQEQVLEIMKLIEDDVQIGVILTTLPSEIMKFAKDYTRDPVIIRQNRPYLALDYIEQYYVATDSEELKLVALLELCLKLEDIPKFVIYCNNRQQIDRVTTRLRESGYLISGLHSNMTIEERESVFRQYRTGEIRILAMTDIMGRFLEFPIASLLINYDIPRSKESYIFRLGRIRKRDCKTVVINLTVPTDHSILREIEEYLDTQFHVLPPDLTIS